MEWTIIEPKTVALRTSVEKLVDDVALNSNGIVAVSDSFESAQEEIRKIDHDVVVCGEAKKGKSSFINAIIGEELLPVNTQVATSQVFRIKNSEEKHFFLVFTDGSQQEITREELTRYGSQVAADMAGEPVFANKVLDYIQIQYPVAFLLQGVKIFDTPGLGAIVEAHERITNAYVKNASAVVFVMDPSAPLTQPEKKFLEKVYSITPFVLFVMTKRDNYDAQIVGSMKTRDEELLNQTFRQKSFEDIVVNPISNVALLKSSQEDNATLKKSFEIKSKFTTVKDKLLLTIYRAVGLSRCQYAYVESCKQSAVVLKFLDDKRKTLTQNNGSSNDYLLKRQQMAKTFETQWGPNSSNMMEINKAIKDAEDGIKSDINYLFTSQHPIFVKYQEMIDAIDNIDDAKSLGGTRNDELSRDVLAEWNSIMKEGVNYISMKLAQFDEKMGEDAVGEAEVMLPAGIEIQQMKKMEIFNIFRGAFLSVALVASILGLAAASVVGLIAVCFFGIRMFREAFLKKAKAQLSKTLRDSYDKLKNDLTLRTEKDRKHTQLQETLMGIDGESRIAVASIYNKHRNSILQQIQQLEEQAKKSEAEKRVEMPILIRQEKAWNGIKQQITSVDQQIKEMMCDLDLNNN